MRLLLRLLGRAAAAPLATDAEVRQRLAAMEVPAEPPKPEVLGRRQIARLREIQSFRELHDASQASQAHSARVARDVARNATRAA
jgi:hypothetical protein